MSALKLQHWPSSLALLGWIPPYSLPYYSSYFSANYQILCQRNTKTSWVLSQSLRHGTIGPPNPASSLLLSIENPVVCLWTSISTSQRILPFEPFRRKLKCILPVPLRQRPCRGSSKFPSLGKDQDQHSVMRDTVCLSWSFRPSSLLPRTYLGLQSCYCICVCMVAIDVLEMDSLQKVLSQYGWTS